MADPWGELQLNAMERAIVAAYTLTHTGLVLVFGTAGLAAVAFDWRAGGYVIAVALLAAFLTRDLFFGMGFRHEGGLAALTPVARVALWASFGSLLVAYVAAAAALGWKAAAWVAVVALVGRLAGDLAVGIASYRAVLARPWPEVQPLSDDDDW